jgi:hypothetical protein
MFNAYMMYGMIRKQVTEAVEYSNIMETAHSILKVADSDMTSVSTPANLNARCSPKMLASTSDKVHTTIPMRLSKMKPTANRH